MRLCTIQTPHGPRVMALRGDHLVDLQGSYPTFPATLRQVLEEAPDSLHLAAEILQRGNAVTVPLAHAAFLPPLADPPKIVCLGLNYRDHAAESGAPIPREPILFSKYATALIGHEQPIVLPPVSQEVDYEAELVIVVGKARPQHPESRTP